MGREIRMVPPNWEHPKKHYIDGEGFHPMYDQTFEEACAEWHESFARWYAGEREQHPRDEGGFYEYWEWDTSPPDRAYYRPFSEEEATWVQLWETVSEGSPVSPPFETREELASYLAEKGDFWDQKRGRGGWGKESAAAFVKAGWAPSMIVTNTPGKRCQVIESKDAALALALPQSGEGAL